MQKFTLVVLMCLSSVIVLAQDIDFFPYPGEQTVCPGMATYTVDPPNNKCGTFTWTVTNGRFFNNVSTGSTVTVVWDDTPKVGKLKVAATCDGTAYDEEKSYVIRSVKGETPANARAFQTLPYCSTAPITIAVDPMTIKNTGFGTTVPVTQYVDVYEWTLPTGWKMNGQSGTVYTTSEMILIQPDHGCTGGSVSVKGIVNSSGCATALSSAATISVNRAAASISVTPPGGYVGPRCGAVNPVAFTATAIGCASNYVWTFPAGWRGPNGELSPYTSTSNVVALTPSGTSADGGTIAVSVHLDCGTNLPGSYTATWVGPNPTISNSGVVCTSGTTFTVVDAPVNSVATWSASSNISINSSTGFATAVGNGAGSISLSLATPCGVFVRTKTVWVGPPSETGINLAVMFGPSDNNLCWNTELGIGVTNTNHASQGVTQYIWNFSSWSGYFTAYDWSPLGAQGVAKFIVNSTTPTPRLLSVRSKNACGMSPQYWEAFNAINCQGGPGGPLLMAAYPVPSNDNLTVSLDKTSGSKNTVKLYDSMSTLVFATVSEEAELTIPVKDLPKGTYYLQINNGKSTERKRILIEH